MSDLEGSDDNHKPGPDPSDDDVSLLRLINSLPGNFGTARDIEPETNVGYKQTRNRLDDLVEEGYLKCRKVGRTKVYWLTDAGESEITTLDV